MTNQHCNRRQFVRSRRDFLQKSSYGFGAMALAHLLGQESGGATVKSDVPDPLAPKAPHFAAKAKSVIFIFLQGGPSQVDTFDPKPTLSRFDGQPLPESFKSASLGLQFIRASEAKLMGSRRTFQACGKSGLEISDLFTALREHADDLAIIRSCYHDTFIHGPALSFLHTGSIRLGAASMGAWVLYGLGSESKQLPAYIVMTDSYVRNSKSLFGSGFLPATYQGTLISTEGVPFENLSPPPQIDITRQRLILDQVREWNGQYQADRPDDTRLNARLHNYELAFKMQMAAPEMIDLSKETPDIRATYGLEDSGTQKFGRMCLLARRMVERGVRFVHMYSSDWDGHAECDKNHSDNARKIDRPIAGLIADLKQRGLLESTLVVCTGEFGRTPVMQGKLGRDHSPYGFTTWMAGGGIRGGKVIGATDDLGFRAVENPVHVHDLHATILSLLGLDHKKLNYFFDGLDRRLTGVGEEGSHHVAAQVLQG